MTDPLSADEIAARFVQSKEGEQAIMHSMGRLDRAFADWLQTEVGATSYDEFDEAYTAVRRKIARDRG